MLETIKIKSDTELGYMVINVEDFNSELHTKFDTENDKVTLAKGRKPKI